MLIRCDDEDRSTVAWAAEKLKLEQSEVVRQALRIGIPLLVRRMKRLSPHSPEVVAVREACRRPVTIAEILEATEEDH